MNSVRLILFLLCSAVVGVFALGCASAGVGHSADNASSKQRTGGMSLDFSVKGPAGERARYVLAEDGTLSFSGGRDVVLEKVSWSGDLTNDEIQQVLDAIQSVGWYELEPASLPTEDQYVYTIDLESPQQNANWTITGDSPYVRPVYVALDQVSRKRFDSYLDRLPQPSLDLHMEEVARKATEEDATTEP